MTLCQWRVYTPASLCVGVVNVGPDRTRKDGMLVLSQTLLVGTKESEEELG